MKKTCMKYVTFLLAFVMVFCSVPLNVVQADAAASYIQVNRNVNPTKILAGEETEVTLDIQGTPPVNIRKPNDVVLVIDKSGSMRNEDRLVNAKAAAKGFIDLILQDTAEHRLGIVDYSSKESIGVFPLSRDGEQAKEYVNNLVANGSTATGDAIATAKGMLDNHRPDAQPVIILLTDGEATDPQNGSVTPYDYAKNISNEAKEAGVVIYTVALVSKNASPNSGPILLMKDIATTEQHHYIVFGSEKLEDTYNKIVKEIGVASAYDVTVKDIVAPEFEIVPNSYENNIPKPTVDGNVLTWHFNELKDKTLTFKYKIKHKEGAKVGKLYSSSDESMITYKDYAGASRMLWIPTSQVEVNHPSPRITSVEPDKGNVKGGEEVTIKGENFRENLLKVTFGPELATNVKWVDSKTVKVTTPAGNQGKVDVILENDDKQQAHGTYQYMADPTITSIDPNHGALIGGEYVHIVGTNFLNGAEVKFGEQAAANVEFKNPTSIYVTSPAGEKPGAVEVTVINPDGTKVALKDGYTYDAPPKIELLSVSPNEGSTDGGEDVTVEGKVFNKDMKVFINNVEAVQKSFINPEKVVVVTPPSEKEGLVDVKVVSPDGTSAQLDKAFKYITPPPPPAPKITQITPSESELEGGILAEIRGEHFTYDMKLYFDDEEVPVIVYNDGQARITVPKWKQAGTVDVKIVGKKGQFSILEKGFTYLAPPKPPQPELTGLEPNEGKLEGGELISVSGNNLTQGTKLFIDNVEIPFIVYNATSGRFTAPPSQKAGAVDVKIVDAENQEFVLTKGYTYLAPPPPPTPKIDSVEPNEGFVAGGEYIAIRGANFAKEVKVYFGSEEVTTIYYSNPGYLQLNTPAAAKAGKVDVKVVNPDGQEFVLANGYEYKNPPPAPAPKITEVEPNEGLVAGGDYIAIRGENIATGAKVYFGGEEASTVYFTSSSYIQLYTPAVTKAGKVDVKVVNPDGQEFVLKGGYEYKNPPPPPAPKITVIEPNEGEIKGWDYIAIRGENFAKGLKVYFGVEESPTVYFTNGSYLQLYTPTATKAGKVDVKVVNPDGQEFVLKDGYEYKNPPPPPKPEINDVSPNEGSVYGGDYVTISGANFENGSTVKFGNSQSNYVYVYNSTTISAFVPVASAAGKVDITVTNPSGQTTTAADAYTYLAPALNINGISPDNGEISGGEFVYITGSGFTTSMELTVDGQQVNFTYYGGDKIAFYAPSRAKGGDVEVVLKDTKFNVMGKTTYKYNSPPPAPTPVIQSISPAYGYVSGNDFVTVYGSGFHEGMKVSIGGKEVPTTVYHSGQLRFITPPGEKVGMVSIFLINRDDVHSNEVSFEYY